jgi:hypothetical protein
MYLIPLPVQRTVGVAPSSFSLMFFRVAVNAIEENN